MTSISDRLTPPSFDSPLARQQQLNQRLERLEALLRGAADQAVAVEESAIRRSVRRLPTALAAGVLPALLAATHLSTVGALTGALLAPLGGLALLGVAVALCERHRPIDNRLLTGLGVTWLGGAALVHAWVLMGPALGMGSGTAAPILLLAAAIAGVAAIAIAGLDRDGALDRRWAEAGMAARGLAVIALLAGMAG